MCTGALQEAYYAGRREAMIDPSHTWKKNDHYVDDKDFDLDVAVVVIPPPRYTRPSKSSSCLSSAKY